MPESVLESTGEHQKPDRNSWCGGTFTRSRPAYGAFHRRSTPGGDTKGQVRRDDLFKSYRYAEMPQGFYNIIHTTSPLENPSRPYLLLNNRTTPDGFDSPPGTATNTHLRNIPHLFSIGF
jgi:hypothetical protein